MASPGTGHHTFGTGHAGCSTDGRDTFTHPLTFKTMAQEMGGTRPQSRCPTDQRRGVSVRDMYQHQTTSHPPSKAARGVAYTPPSKSERNKSAVLMGFVPPQLASHQHETHRNLGQSSTLTADSVGQRYHTITGTRSSVRPDRKDIYIPDEQKGRDVAFPCFSTDPNTKGRFERLHISGRYTPAIMNKGFREY